MPTTEIECQRDSCPETFRVGKEETARCPASTSESMAADGGETTVEAPAGATVRITIEVVPGGEAN